MIYTMEAVLLVIINLVIVLVSVMMYKQCRLWYDAILIILGVLWTSLYVFVLLSEPRDAVWFGQTFIRPLNIVTFTMIIVLRYVLLIKQKLGGCNGDRRHK